jgi:dephospho-CoA kinase
MAVVVGITGGIGSGKSTICNVFRILNVPVFEADVAARHLMNTEIKIKLALVQLFGEDIYTANGELNRAKLAREIFGNSDLLERVNALVHPAVRIAFYHWLKQNDSFPYVIYEAAILFEAGFYEKMDFSILITAPEKDRIERVMNRQEITEQSVRERMKTQWTDEKKKKLATLCLKNDNRNMILPEIIRIDKKIKTDGTIW